MNRLSPHNIEIEEKVLYLYMANGAMIVRSYEEPQECYFYDTRTQKIFHLIKETLTSTGECSVPIIADLAKEHSTELEEYVLDLRKKHGLEFAEDRFPGYVNILKSYVTRRQTLELSEKLQRLGNEVNVDYIEIMKEIEDIKRSTLTLDYTGRPKTIYEDLIEYCEELAPLEGIPLDERTVDTGITTGFENIDTLIGGFKGGDYYLLAANPSMGKTTLAMNFTIEAMKQKKHVVFVSAEMTIRSLAKKYFEILTGKKVDSLVKEKKSFLPELKKIMDDIDFTEHCTVIDDGKITSQVAYDFVKARKIEGRCDMVVVDYIGLLKYTGKHKNKAHQVEEISGDMKRIAKDFDVPVLCLSQLNRSNVTVSTKGDTKMRRPMMNDLRDSGALEQDADVIMMLYSKDYQQGAKERYVECLVRKQRMGRDGGANLIFYPEISTFKQNNKTLFVDFNDDPDIEKSKVKEFIL